uniref:Uncharacterized protein n=1 Tax=Trichogramma kaykai TaxID=54128 RepID=A0ABD2W0W1_9HYME
MILKVNFNNKWSPAICGSRCGGETIRPASLIDRFLRRTPCSEDYRIDENYLLRENTQGKSSRSRSGSSSDEIFNSLAYARMSRESLKRFCGTVDRNVDSELVCFNVNHQVYVCTWRNYFSKARMHKYTLAHTGKIIIKYVFSMTSN